MPEPEGGDAACWAHLVDDFAPVDGTSLCGVVAVDWLPLPWQSTEVVPWSTRSADLNVNLLHFGRQGMAWLRTSTPRWMSCWSALLERARCLSTGSRTRYALAASC